MLAALSDPILLRPEPKRLLSDRSQNEKHRPRDLVEAGLWLSTRAVGRGPVGALEERREWQLCLNPEQVDKDQDDQAEQVDEDQDDQGEQVDDLPAAGEGQVEPVVGGDGGVQTGEAAEDN